MNSGRDLARGYTLIEIMIVMAIIGLLSAIVYPAYYNARERSMTSACLNNLRQIAGAKDAYALDHANNAPPDVAALVPAYISHMPTCPANGTYTIQALGQDPTCNITGHSL